MVVSTLQRAVIFGISLFLVSCDQGGSGQPAGKAVSAHKPVVEVKAKPVPAASGKSIELNGKKYPAVTVKLNLQKVSPHVYYIKGHAGSATEYEGFISNAGVVITPVGIVVFDALGSPSLAAAMVKKIREISELPIKKVVVSHYHADHIYGLQVFKDLGAQIIAPGGALEYLNSSNAANLLDDRKVMLDPWVNDNTRLVRPDKIITGPYQFSLGGVEFQLTYLGSAHSEGDMTLYVKTDKVLFSGDLIFEGRIPYIGSSHTKNWLKRLKSLELGGVNALIPGHGGAAKQPQQAITATREYLEFLHKKMGEAVAEIMGFEEAYSRVDWNRFKKIPAFDAANRGNAYRVYRSLESDSLK